MRYLFGFLCVCALGVLPMVGCDLFPDQDPIPCEGVVCDDVNECTEDECDPATGTCKNYPSLEGTGCTGGFCVDRVVCESHIDECTADDLAAIEAGDEPNIDAIADCMEAVEDLLNNCVNPMILCFRDSETALSDECSSCFAFQACCEATCTNDRGGICTGPVEPGDGCERCWQERCQPYVDVCVGGQ